MDTPSVVLKMAQYKDTVALEKQVGRIVRACTSNGVVVDPDNPSSAIVIDLEGIPFVLSSTIAQIVRLYKFCHKSKVPFKVINAGQSKEMFDILRLTSLFEVLE